MALTLISVEDGYAVYEDEYGEQVLLAGQGPIFRQVIRWGDFDLAEAWRDALADHRQIHTRWWSKPNRDAFVESLADKILDHESIDVVWCESCEEPLRTESAESIGNGSHACESCFEDNYRSCDDCGSVRHFDDMYYVGDSYVCEGCINSNYSHCDECDTYYHHDYSSDHRHGGCDCDPPTLAVQMRHGEATLTEDDRVTISLPSGMISEEAMRSIVRLVQNHANDIYTAVYQSLYEEVLEAGGNPYSIYENKDLQAADAERNKWWNFAPEVFRMDPNWQTREGNFTKRLSKLAHKSQGLKVAPDLLTKIGNIARENSVGSDYEVEMTRDLNLPAENFYHEDSCWWQSYSESRCALKNNGGIGMRTFNDYGSVSGRAWVMPLRLVEGDRLEPTFDGLAPDAFMVFNGYGDLSGYTPARLVAQMAGMTYRKVGFDANPMYVNNNNGYLVTSEEIASKYPAGSHVSLTTPTHGNLYHTEQAARELVNA